MQKKLKLKLTKPVINRVEQYPWLGDIAYISDNKMLLQHGLLSSRQQHLNKPVEVYLLELRTLIKDLFAQAGTKIHPVQISQVYGLAVSIFIALGLFRQAREICYSMIQIFLEHGKRVKKQDVLKHVFQPWVQLIRIDRLEGNFHAAHNKINALNMAQETLDKNGDESRVTDNLHYLIREDVSSARAINMNIMLERIHAYLDAKHYQEIIRTVPLRTVSNAAPIQQEALAIALANTGKISDALNVLAHAKTCPDRELQRIFCLREFELLTAIAGKDVVGKEIHITFTRALNLFNREQVHTHHITWALHAASVIKMSGQSEFALRLAYESLAAAERNSDELLQANSLVLLYELISARQGKEIIEDMMIELYYHTQYVQVRQLLLSVCADLAHVQVDDEEDEMEALYEYLLVLSNNVCVT